MTDRRLRFVIQEDGIKWLVYLVEESNEKFAYGSVNQETGALRFTRVEEEDGVKPFMVVGGPWAREIFQAMADGLRQASFVLEGDSSLVSEAKVEELEKALAVERATVDRILTDQVHRLFRISDRLDEHLLRALAVERARERSPNGT